jgi:hypothetical protein
VVAPYGRRLGLRVSDSHYLDSVVSLCREFEWDILDEDTVDALVSLRFAPPPSRGKKHFNILFYGGNPVKRTLCQSEMWQALVEQLPAWARFRPVGMALYTGLALRASEGVTVLVASPQHRPPWLTSVSWSEYGVQVLEEASFAVLEDGSFHYPGTTNTLKKIILPSGEKGRAVRMSPAQAALTLFGHSTTRLMDPATALAAASKAVSSVPVYGVELGSGPVMPDEIRSILLEG